MTRRPEAKQEINITFSQPQLAHAKGQFFPKNNKQFSDDQSSGDVDVDVDDNDDDDDGDGDGDGDDDDGADGHDVFYQIFLHKNVGPRRRLYMFFFNTYVSTHRHSQTQKKFPPQVRSKKIVILKQFVTKGSQWTHQFAHTSIFDHHGAFRTGRVTKHKF